MTRCSRFYPASQLVLVELPVLRVVGQEVCGTRGTLVRHTPTVATARSFERRSVLPLIAGTKSKVGKSRADTRRVTAREDSPGSGQGTVTADAALLHAGMGAEADDFLCKAARAGVDAQLVSELIRERTGGLLSFSAARVAALLHAAAQSAPPDVEEQTRADRAAAEGFLGRPFGPFVREHIAAGDRGEVIAAVLAEASGGTLVLNAARVGRLIQDERERGGPYDKPPKPTRTTPGDSPRPSPKKTSRARAAAPTSGDPAKRPAENRPTAKPKRLPQRGSRKWLRLLKSDLDRALRTPSDVLAMKHARIAKSKGVRDSKLAAEVREALVGRGAPATLTVADVRLLLRDAGWRTGKDRAQDAAGRRAEGAAQAAERARRAARDRDLRQPSARDDHPRGFWAGIANERYVRPVGGGLPGLGKRR